MSGRRGGRVPRRGLGVLVLLAAAGVWEAWARARPSFVLPPASEVAARAWAVVPSPEFLEAVATSLQAFAAGLAIGVLAGAALGVLLGASPQLRRTLDPTIELLRATPPVALVPLAIVVFGFGGGMRVSLIAFAVFFPVLVGTIDGVRSVPAEAHDVAALAHLRLLERISGLLLPGALPSMLAGVRIALSIGLLMVVVSEYSGGGGGLGHFILLSQRMFNVPDMYVGILSLGLLGWALNAICLRAEGRLLAGHRGAAGEREP